MIKRLVGWTRRRGKGGMKRPDQGRVSNCLIPAAQVFPKMPMDSHNSCGAKPSCARHGAKNLQINR